MLDSSNPRSPVSPNGNVYGIVETEKYEGGNRPESAQDNLEDGALVVMYFRPGQLAIVRGTGKFWSIEPCAIEDMSDELDVYFFPSAAVFTVVRREKYFGFKSLAADGRTLQATSADNGVPLRVNNHNFGAWEQWEMTPSGIVNRKFPQRALNFEIQEIQTVSLENLRRHDKRQLQSLRTMQKQVKNYEMQRQKLERDVADLQKLRRRNAMLHKREIEDFNGRLDEALGTKQKLEVDMVQVNACVRRQDLQIQQLTVQRDAAKAKVADVEATQRSEEKQIELLKEKFQTDMEALQRSYQNEIEALKRDQAHAVERSTKRAQEEINALRQRLEHGEGDKEREIRRLQAEHEHILRQRAIERDNLREDNHRLMQALQKVRQKVQYGIHQLHKDDIHSSFRSAYDDRVRSGGASPLPPRLYSPAPSRGSNRRDDDFPDGASQIERSGPLVDSLPTPHSERPGIGHFEPYSSRSSMDGGYPRRADSRQSDSFKPHSGGEDVCKRQSLENRRTTSYGQISNSNGRYSPQIDSIVDSKAENSKHYMLESAEVKSDEGKNTDEVHSDTREDLSVNPDQDGSFVMYKSDLPALKEQEDLAIDSDTKSIDSESAAAMVKTIESEADEIRSASLDRPDSRHSTIDQNDDDDEGVTPTSLLTDMMSEESEESRIVR